MKETRIKKGSKKRLIIVSIISVTLLVFLLWYIGIDSIITVISTADPRYLALALVVEPFILLLRAHRWKIIVSRLGYPKLGLKKASFLYLTGLYGGSFTPSKIGDLLRAYLLARDADINVRVPAGKAVFSIVLDRVLDVISLITIVLVGVPLFIESLADFQYVLLMGVVMAALLIGFSFLLFSEKYGEKVINIVATPILRVIGGVFKEKQRDTTSKIFDQFSESVSAFRDEKVFLIGVYFYSIIIWLSTCCQAYLVLAALQPNLPNLLQFVTIFPLSMFAALIPVTISGLGTREAAMVVIMSIIGVSAVTAFVLSITFAFVSLWLPAIGGGIYVTFRSIEKVSE
ncbi:MAG: lysylphosphatidylglycerol synthase transmembrane domain-containing protein [Promethearchaeota archaeon]